MPRWNFCRVVLSIVLFAGTCPLLNGQAPRFFDLNTLLMQATFRIQEQTAGCQAVATGFIVGRPYTSDPSKARLTLITAAHVLKAAIGDSVTLMLRHKQLLGWQQLPIPVAIRAGGRPLWVEHPNADVAAIYVAVPTALMPEIISTDLLADDAVLTKFEIHPGDELNCLGYPLGFESTGGFPILRSGEIASYPLVPTTENPYFLLDFRVFQGNSGGPVYFVQANRFYGGGTHIEIDQFIIGLVSEEVGVTQQFQGLYENRSQTYPLGLAKIVPATYIKAVINLLPAP
jgi:S1-C subfamily serine protease